MNATQPSARPSTPVPDAPDTGGRWSPLRIGIGLILAGLAIWAGLRAWSDILYIAQRDEEASQVWLVLPIFVWLAWTRRAAIVATAPRFSWLGPLLIAGGLGGSLYGFLNLNQAAWHGGAVLALVGAFATVAGRPLVMRMLPALIVLAFWVPVPGMIRQQIAIPLQTASAAASEFVFTLLGLPVDRTGNILIYNGQEVAVAEACNGMRMVFALLLVAYAFAFANPLRPSVRAMVLIFQPGGGGVLQRAAAGADGDSLRPEPRQVGTAVSQPGGLGHAAGGFRRADGQRASAAVGRGAGDE